MIPSSEKTITPIRSVAPSAWRHNISQTVPISLNILRLSCDLAKHSRARRSIASQSNKSRQIFNQY